MWDTLRKDVGLDWEGGMEEEGGGKMTAGAVATGERVAVTGEGGHRAVVPRLFRLDQSWLRGGFSSQALMEEFLHITRWDMVTMGAPGAGINFHWDAIHCGSWQLQLAGSKRWVVCPAN